MADKVKVNAAAWKALPKEQQNAIADILSQSFGNVSIVGDPKTAAPTKAMAAFKFPGGLCNILCDVAAMSGHIACGKLPASAQAICNAGVDAAQALCKSKCK